MFASEDVTARAKERKTLFIDFETRSRADLKAVGAHRYGSDPSTEILCIAYAVDDGAVKIWKPGNSVPAAFVKASGRTPWIVVAHNAAFERAILAHLLEPHHGFPSIPLERWRCTMARARACALPSSLEKVAVVLELEHQKDADGERIMRRLAKPRADGSWDEDPEALQRLYEYCKSDVETERALFKVLPELHPEEQLIWQLDQTINGRGFYTDGKLIEAAHVVVEESKRELLAEFNTITGLFSEAQVARLIVWLADHECPVTDLQKATVSHALRRKGLSPEVTQVLKIRQALAHTSGVAKIEALRAWRMDDDRVRGTFGYHVAGTGRWAGHGPQPQNFKRGGEGIAEKIDAVLAGGDGLASPIEAVGDISRATICAPPGHRLLSADLCGAESRVLGWVAGERTKIDAWAKFDHTGDPRDDPYVRLAQRCSLTGDGARDVGKTIDLSFGFGGGVKAWKGAATDEVTIKRYRNTWRAEHPAICKFWKAVDHAAISAVRNPGTEFQVRRISYRYEAPFLRLKLPSGRMISYPFAKIDGWDRFGSPKLTFLDNAGGKFVPCRHGQGAWFGLLVENIVQGIARDLLAAALVRLEAAGYPIVLHVHDELVAEVPIGSGSLEEFRAIVETVPAWAEGLPVAAKVRESARFSKEDGARCASWSSSPADDPAIDGDEPHDDQNSSTISMEAGNGR